MRYSVSKKQLENIEEFARESLNTHRGYKRRRQYNMEAIRNQIITGKIGEYVTYKFLKDQCYKCSRPDLKIYSAGKKSWEADLKAHDLDDLLVHVKSQTFKNAGTYGLSWIFQLGSDGYSHVDPILKGESEPNEYISFVMLNGTEGEVKAFLPANDLFKKALFDDPKLKKLVGYKKAVYYERLVEVLGDNLVQV